MKVIKNTRKNDTVSLQVARETEKAVAVEVRVEIVDQKDQTRLAWFPKSMIDGGDGVAIIPGWMFSERMAEIREEFVKFGITTVKTIVKVAK